MLEELQLLFPGRYDLPNENQLRVEIARLISIQKGQKGARAIKSGARGRKRRPDRHADALSKIVEENPNVKPANAEEFFREYFSNETESLPTSKEIRSKVSAMKMKMKKKSLRIS